MGSIDARRQRLLFNALLRKGAYTWEVLLFFNTIVLQIVVFSFHLQSVPRAQAGNSRPISIPRRTARIFVASHNSCEICRISWSVGIASIDSVGSGVGNSGGIGSNGGGIGSRINGAGVGMSWVV